MHDENSSNSGPGEFPDSSELRGLDPGELLARGLHSVKRSGGTSAWQPPTPEELSGLLPQYRIESMIGRGGMGAVYKGTQLVLDRTVAIKLLPAEVASDGQFIARFHREARTLARLQHSRIVTVHDFGQTSDGQLYFVMEYIDGTDLRKILRGPGLTPEQALLVVGQICDALHAAHSQGVIHRDIKPENILITKDGYVKLADFGLARPAKHEESIVLTMTNMVIGTADYMAPEQREGKTDERADIFALGVMLYEMLTGKPPRGAFEPASSRMPGMNIDVRIDEVVLKALQSEPARRYQKVSEMKTDVDRIRNTPAPGPAPHNPPQQMTAQAGNRRQMWMVGSAILASLVGLLALLYFFQRGHPNSPTANASPSSNPDFVTGAAAQTDGQEHGILNGKDLTGRKDLAPRSTPASDPKAQTNPPSPVVNAPSNVTRPSSAPLQVASLNAPRTPSQSPVRAAKDAPLINSLGMKFIPVEGTKALFSVWDTRVQDYAEFAFETGNRWRKPDYEQGPTHPVVNVSWENAQAFCAWLTETERRFGKIGARDLYRLPTNAEWSVAVGLGVEKGSSQEDMENNGSPDVFPWGTQWPPPTGVGNYSTNMGVDSFAHTSPVGSFAANRYGLFDMGGNVWQWCEDWYTSKHDLRTVRGGSWTNAGRYDTCSSSRGTGPMGSECNCYGFRCVLEVGDPAAITMPVAQSDSATKPAPAVPNSSDLTASHAPPSQLAKVSGTGTAAPELQSRPLGANNGTGVVPVAPTANTFQVTAPRQAPPSRPSAEPTTMNEALLNYKYSWNIYDRSMFVTALFHPDSTVTILGQDGRERTWTWWVRGPNVAHVADEDDKRVDDIKFMGNDFSQFKGFYGSEGRRIDPVGAGSHLSPPASAVPGPKPEISKLKVLSDEAPNVQAWATAPLYQFVPEDIYQKMAHLQQDLLDEKEDKVRRNPALVDAYAKASGLCAQFKLALDARSSMIDAAGGPAPSLRSNLTEYRRDNLSWPMWAEERDERKERREWVAVHQGQVDKWAKAAQEWRTRLDRFYIEFRQHWRDSAHPQL